MNKEQLFSYLVPRVNDNLLLLGFDFKKSRDGFVKKIDDGWIRVAFSFYQFAESGNINMGFEVRKNSVEELYVQYVKINPSNHKTIPTVNFPLTSLCKHSWSSYSFDNEKELLEILNSKVLLFIEHKLPHFIDKYSSIGNIYKLYRYPEEENNHLISRNYSNYVRTLILGRFALDDEGFEGLIGWCKEKVMNIISKTTRQIDAEQQQNDFKRLVADLSSRKFVK